MPPPLLILCALLIGAAALVAGEVAVDPLQRLPLPPTVVVGVAPALGKLAVIAPGIHVNADEKCVVLDGILVIDDGPKDGLEVLACLTGGKQHESLIRLLTNNGQLVKFAFITAFGLPDGEPAATGRPDLPLVQRGLPGRGIPLRVTAHWQRLDKQWVAVDVSCLVRDRRIDRGYPPLPYIYTGSRMTAIQGPGPDGAPARREQFMLDSTKSVLVNFDDGDALFSSPLPVATMDERFEANSALTPAVETPLRLVFKRTTVPLTLHLGVRGLAIGPDAAPLDDAALARLLGAAYLDPKPALHAVAVQVEREAPREGDVAARERILAAAAQAKVWVTPVFTLVEPAAP